jgi:hypothetical protein
MKQYTLLVFILAIFSGCISCNNQGNKKEVSQAVSSSEVNIYYFHFTRRCATCLAVEENARKAVEALYSNEVKTGEYSFTSLNLDEESTKEIADKLGVGGQSLMVVRGDRKVDITAAAWLAAHDPDKMKAEIKSGIDKILF